MVKGLSQGEKEAMVSKVEGIFWIKDFILGHQKPLAVLVLKCGFL